MRCTTNKAACGIETTDVSLNKGANVVLHHQQSRVRH